MLQKDFPDPRIFAQTFQVTFHGITGGLKLVFPGVFFFAGHIVGGMVTGYDHEGGQMDLFRVECVEA